MGSTAGWVAVGAITVATMAIKAAGPVALGGRPLPPRLVGVIGLLAPALLAALVATSTFGSSKALVLDARALGVAVGAVAVLLRAPTLVVVILAAAATAAARALGWN